MVLIKKNRCSSPWIKFCYFLENDDFFLEICTLRLYTATLNFSFEKKVFDTISLLHKALMEITSFLSTIIILHVSPKISPDQHCSPLL